MRWFREARALIGDVVAFSQQRIRVFSSSPAYFSPSPRQRTVVSDKNETAVSLVYRHKLKIQRPTTIEVSDRLYNSVSFIGTIDRPLKPIGEFGSFTWLTVNASPRSNRYFKVLLKMWDEMSKISMQHLKPNDYIYVSGHLGSYTKADVNGKLRTNYEVNVKEINFVTRNGQSQTCQKSEQPETRDSGETALEKRRKRLQLWQEFFSNPYEWRDCRKSKVNRNQPDFRHRNTGEVLWLRSDDPPWINKQLEQHDSRFAEGGDQREHLRFGSHISPLVYDD